MQYTTAQRQTSDFSNDQNGLSKLKLRCLTGLHNSIPTILLFGCVYRFETNCHLMNSGPFLSWDCQFYPQLHGPYQLIYGNLHFDLTTALSNIPLASLKLWAERTISELSCIIKQFLNQSNLFSFFRLYCSDKIVEGTITGASPKFRDTLSGPPMYETHLVLWAELHFQTF